MRNLGLSCAIALAMGVSGAAQSGFGLSVAPIPNWIITPFGAGGGTIEGIQHMKLANNPDGVWTSALTVGRLISQWGGDNSSLGVVIGIFDPYSFTYDNTDEAANLNSSANDKHLALSPDGLWAIFEREQFTVHMGVFVATRAAVGQQFGSPVAVAGFPPSALTQGEVDPYFGPVGGQMMCFYSDGSNLLMQPIDLNMAAPTLTGTATVVATAAQGGALVGAPSPIFGADGDVEMLWAMDVVVPRTSPGTGDADPTLHNDLDPTTPGIVQVQRTDWQGYGGIAGGFVYFSHDIVPQHVMHAEGAVLVGDAEPPGGMADLMTMAPNYGSPAPLQGAILIGTGLMPGVPLFGFHGRFALSGFSSLVLPTITTTKDGDASISFPLPNNPSLSGVAIPLQALTVDSGPPQEITWSNTAWLRIL